MTLGFILILWHVLQLKGIFKWLKKEKRKDYCKQELHRINNANYKMKKKAPSVAVNKQQQ